MNNKNITHRNFLYGIQDNIVMFVINTYQLVGIDAQQCRTVIVYLALRLVSGIVVTLREPHDLTDLYGTRDRHVQTVIVCRTIDIYLQRDLTLHVQFLGLPQVLQRISEHDICLKMLIDL